ncbi:hypothetical protein BCR34DRAFT_18900 [Clohesyomyces aquaticus]|uniref:Uncharacterized protein n=1 Tax=Clohesyomyces aquaticus TaxID=1231657 RepID=A0A1Y1ZB27_9PLEO|nr:hypothetical protein BCR34DRAFT_18900 [Clohesyomyces aquaticus]
MLTGGTEGPVNIRSGGCVRANPDFAASVDSSSKFSCKAERHDWQGNQNVASYSFFSRNESLGGRSSSVEERSGAIAQANCLAYLNFFVGPGVNHQVIHCGQQEECGSERRKSRTGVFGRLRVFSTTKPLCGVRKQFILLSSAGSIPGEPVPNLHRTATTEIIQENEHNESRSAGALTVPAVLSPRSRVWRVAWQFWIRADLLDWVDGLLRACRVDERAGQRVRFMLNSLSTLSGTLSIATEQADPNRAASYDFTGRSRDFAKDCSLSAP